MLRTTRTALLALSAVLLALPRPAPADITQLFADPTVLSIGDLFTEWVVVDGEQRGAYAGPSAPGFSPATYAEPLSCTGTECIARLVRGALSASVVTSVVEPLLTTQTCYDGPLAFQARRTDAPGSGVIEIPATVSNRCRTLSGTVRDEDGQPMADVYLWIEAQVPANYLVENPAFIMPFFVPNGRSAWYALSPIHWGYVARTNADGTWSAVVPNIATDGNLLASMGPDQCGTYVRNGFPIPPDCGRFLGYAVAPFAAVLTNHASPFFGPLTYCDDPAGTSCGIGHTATIDEKIIAQRGTDDFEPRYRDGLLPQDGDLGGLDFTALPPASLTITNVTLTPAHPHPGDELTLTLSVRNDGGQSVETVQPTIDFGGSDAVTAVTLHDGARTLAVDATAQWTYTFEATHAASVTARVRAAGTAAGSGKTVTSLTVPRTFEIVGATMGVTLTAEPNAPSPGDDFTIVATIVNQSDQDLTDVQPDVALTLTPGDDVVITGPVPPSVASLPVGGEPAILRWTVHGGLGRLKAKASIGARDPGDNLVTAQGRATITVGMPLIDWEIEPRFEDADDVADTTEDANPERYWFQATMKRSDGSTCDTRFTPKWKIGGEPLVTDAVPGKPCTFRFERANLDVFDLDVDLLRDGEVADSGSVTIEAKDILIASLGDAVSAGEGVLDGGAWTLHQCERSLAAGPAQAALVLERDDPHSVITFVHQACSGARSDRGVLNAFQGFHPGEGAMRSPQIGEARRIAGKRKIDILLLSIGINDLEFSGIAELCALDSDCLAERYHDVVLQQWLAAAKDQLPATYSALAHSLALHGVDPADTYLLEYPDPSRDESLACDDTEEFVPVYGHITRPEWQWLSGALLFPLNGIGGGAATQHGWNRIGGLATEFGPHGLCAPDPWMTGLAHSSQRDDIQRGFHPNEMGHSVYANYILSTLRPRVLAHQEGHTENLPTQVKSTTLRGADRLEVENDHYEVGDQVTINPGAENQETRTIVGKGSLIFDRPLAHDHAAFEPIIRTADLPAIVRDNHAPYAYDDVVSPVCEQETIIDVLANDVDIDEGDELSIVAVDSPYAYIGWADGPVLFHAPVTADFEETFTYTVQDTWGATSQGRVRIVSCGGSTTTTSTTSTTEVGPVTTTTETSTTSAPTTSETTTTETTSTTVEAATTTTTTPAPTRHEPLAGKSLTLRDHPTKTSKKSLAFILNAPTLGLGADSVDDPRLVGATLHVVGAAGGLDATYLLPAANWTARIKKGAVIGWLYKDRTFAAGPIGAVTLQAGKSLQVSGKGAALAYALSADPVTVSVALRIGAGDLVYCGTFGGKIAFKPGTQWKATGAPAPASCVAP
jgi:hypothetical protein